MAHPTPDALALVALGEDADVEVLEHVGGCRTCYDEVAALQHVVTVGRSLGPDDQLTSPDPRVWQRIVAELHDGRVGPARGGATVLNAPAAVPDELAARRRPAPRRRGGTIAVAAAAALVVGLGGGYAIKSLADSGSEAATTQLNALPGYPGASGTARIEDGSDGQRTLVVAVQLPATVAVDGTMEVWMSDTRAQDMMAMGPMTGDSARFPIPASFDLSTHPIVDVSLEPRNDSSPAHSDASVVRGRLNV